MTDLTNPRAVLATLEQRARKRFGQHFLARRDVVERTVRLAGVKEGDKVLEIGPGLGVLTEALQAVGAQVTAVEVDSDLAAWLRETRPGLTLVEGDATKLRWAEVCPGSGWKLVANLPYNVGTGLVMDALRRPATFHSVTVMLQAEVVDRLIANPDDDAWGALSVEAMARMVPAGRFTVTPDAFVPPPRVMSAVVRLDVRPEAAVGPAGSAGFDRAVRAGFSARRKTLRNTLGGTYGRERAEAALAAVGIDPSTRGETLTLGQWQQLAAALTAPVATPE